MLWRREARNYIKGVFWKTACGNFIIRRGPDNDAELVMRGDAIFRGTQDECKREAERIK